jgi:hypothetical protein
MMFGSNIKHIHEEQRQKFLGTASIRLEALDFSLTQVNKLPGNEPDWDNVKSLGGLFLGGAGFAPHHLCHQIPALINPVELSQVLSDGGIPTERLTRTDVNILELELPPDTRVLCLRGQDSILAAMRVALDADRRWVIRLYAKGMPSQIPAVSGELF